LKEKDKGNFLAGALIFAGLVIYWLATDRKRMLQLLEYRNDENVKLSATNNHLISRVNEYQENLNELKSLIDDSEDIDHVLKKKIKHLIDTYEEIDTKVSNELMAAMALINAKQPGKAVFSMAKIVENLLKEKYSTDPNFKVLYKSKKPSFHDLLDFAKKQGAIEPEEYHFAKGLKEIRNQEGHELDVIKGDNWLHSALFTGIGLILKIGNTTN
jgi:DNA repair exonuclease SbcCD ATPase subunit